jgi:hypothetical protein
MYLGQGTHFRRGVRRSGGPQVLRCLRDMNGEVHDG